MCLQKPKIGWVQRLGQTDRVPKMRPSEFVPSIKNARTTCTCSYCALRACGAPYSYPCVLLPLASFVRTRLPLVICDRVNGFCMHSCTFISTAELLRLGIPAVKMSSVLQRVASSSNRAALRSGACCQSTTAAAAPAARQVAPVLTTAEAVARGLVGAYLSHIHSPLALLCRASTGVCPAS